MSIKDKVAINVLNYNEFIVSATTQIQGYIFEPSVDNVPTMQSMSFTEIQHLNGKSDAFRSGLLCFESVDEQDVYEALSITNWQDIITNKFIEDAIINSTMDKLQKLIDIVNPSVFDRVKTILIRLQNSGAYDISNRVINTLMARDDELRHRIYRSEIVLKPKEKAVAKTESNEEVEELKSQLEEMKAMMAQILNQNNGDNSSIETRDELSNSDENEEDKSTQKRGRAAQKSK